MIDFKALGSAEIFHAQGHPIGSVLAQPRRLALLAYLALCVPRGFQRRDTLLGLFWPESDADKARAALRQAVHFLRSSLGASVLVNRGEEEIGVAPDTMVCDVVRFEALLDEGEDAAALECYRGDLLEGFFIADAPEWERWLDAERSRLRRRAAAAADRLADGAAAAGSWVEAIPWGRRACALAAGDESAVRRLISILDRSGDRAGALAEYEDFAARLAVELEVEPSPETRALVDAIRRRTAVETPVRSAHVADAAAAAADQAAAAEPAAAGRGPVLAPASAALAAASAGVADAEPAPARTRRRTLSALLAMAAAVVLLLAASAAYVASAGRDSSTLNPQRFLVLPFENLTGDPALDLHGRIAADMITHGITGIPGVEVVPTMTMLGSAQYLEIDATSLSRPEGLRALARELGAGRVISGSYYLQGDRLLLQARVSDMERSVVLRALDSSTASTADSALAGVEQLSTRIRAALAPLVEEDSHARAGMTPPSYEAYRAYVSGMEAFVGRDLEGSLRHMQRAAAEDSTYAMPLIVTAIIHMNLGDWHASDSVTRRVDGLRDQLGPMELAMQDMISAWIRGDNGSAYDAVVRQTSLAPGSIAHYQVAEQARRLNRPREALRVLQELTPDGGEPRGELRGWRSYWRELAWSHHALGNHRAELKAARRARKLYPDDPGMLLHEARALAALGRLHDVENLVQERLAGPSDIEPSPGLIMRVLGLELRAHGHDAGGQQLLERSADWYATRPPAMRERVRYGLAMSLYTAGRSDESEALFRQLAQESPEQIRPMAYLGLLAARRGDRREAERIAAWLRDLDRPYLFGENYWWRALIAARLDDHAQAVSLLREAIAQGRHYTPGFHIEIDLEPIRNDAAYRALMRPAR
jgi:DNA-binding SARP family transcriptional activator/TolB-like protein/tetratricopeptide (TPR) repeat protein